MQKTVIMLDKTVHRRTMPLTEANGWTCSIVRARFGVCNASDDLPDGQTARLPTIVLLEDQGDFPCY